MGESEREEKKKKRDAGEGENLPQSGKVSGATSTGAKGASARVKCHVDHVLRGRFLVLSVFNVEEVNHAI